MPREVSSQPHHPWQSIDWVSAISGGNVSSNFCPALYFLYPETIYCQIFCVPIYRILVEFSVPCLCWVNSRLFCLSYLLKLSDPSFIQWRPKRITINYSSIFWDHKWSFRIHRAYSDRNRNCQTRVLRENVSLALYVGRSRHRQPAHPWIWTTWASIFLLRPRLSIGFF